MKKVIVTGGTGFVGSNVVRWLIKDGHEVHLIVRPESQMWRLQDVINDVYLHVIDYAYYKDVSLLFHSVRPDWVIHMAAYGAYPFRYGKPFQQDVLEMVRTNNVGNAVLVQCAAENDVELFINAGSSSEYGLKGSAMSESDVLEPVDNYGASKAGAGLLAITMAEALGLRLYHVRLFSVYGPYEEPARFIPTVVRGFITGKPLRLANPNSVRDFIHVDDVISALKYFSTHLPPAGTYNLGSGHQSTTGSVVELLNEMAGRHVQVQWGQIQSRPNEPKCWVANIEKLLAVGWAPGVDLRSGLQMTYDWFKRYGSLYDQE